jgi:hypothetical protein
MRGGPRFRAGGTQPFGFPSRSFGKTCHFAQISPKILLAFDEIPNILPSDGGHLQISPRPGCTSERFAVKIGEDSMKTATSGFVRAALGLLIAAVAVSGSLARAAVVFDNGDKLNLVKSDLTTITATATDVGKSAQTLVGRNESSTAWQDTSGSIAPQTTLTVNLGASRNLQTIKLWSSFASYGLLGATVQTSPDNVTYTTQSGTLSNPNTSNTQIVLDNPVNAQYVKITGTNYQNGGTGNHRWIVNQLQILGGAGTVTDDSHLNLISSTAFATSPTMTLTNISVTSTTAAQFIDDSLTPLQRGVLYGLGSTSSLVVDFKQSVPLGKFGLQASNITTGTSNTTFQFTVETSPDNATWSNVLSQTGVVAGPNFFTLTPTTARYMRFAVQNAGSSTIYIADISAFSPVPEPSSLAAIGLGAIALLARRRAAR